MTRLWNDPSAFADEMIDGFVAANGRYVRSVRGGVVRSTVVPDGQVAVVIGGGSGHYPAFGGLVGAGLAHGAAMGNLFASPSTQQVHAVATAAEHGGGVLLAYGNYAGDVLNFDAAADELRRQGIPCESVAVTDDISSASIAEKHRRRGVAGDLTVFRAAAAAAERGDALEDVARVARLANERTRSFGVAFSGCTLPGAASALFSVPDGRMAVGLGIHGEPGIDETDIPSADGLAELLVGRLLEELPDGVPTPAGQRVVPVLNGLGSLKYEELFVVYRRVAQLLEASGVVIVDPHVGEYCTSFDMSGLSLTLFWLDEELADLWDTPVDTPAYRRGSVGARAQADAVGPPSIEDDAIPPASDAARAAAPCAAEVIVRIAAMLDDNVDELGRMDAIAGDGDHGIGMQRGARAAAAAAAAARDAGAGAGTVLTRAGDAWADRAGGTSGALWGVMLRAVGAAVGDDSAPTPAAVSAGVTAAAAGVTAYGKAELGDKTLVDALLPLRDALASAVSDGADLATAWRDAADAATTAAAATADLLPRMGRARPHAEKSLGTADPGAHSLALAAQTVRDAIRDSSSSIQRT